MLSKNVKCAITHTASCFNQSCIGCDGEKFESKKCEDVRNCSGAGAPRHDQRKGFYVDTVVDSRYLEMDVVREREGSFNGNEVENGAMHNGMCRKIL